MFYEFIFIERAFQRLVPVPVAHTNFSHCFSLSFSLSVSLCAQWWVRRFFVLLRREQIDPMVETPTNVLHELCTFQNDNEFAECLSSILLEDVVAFARGADAGIPAHVLLARAAAANERKQLALVSNGGAGAGAAAAQTRGSGGTARHSTKVRSTKKSMFDDLFNALATVRRVSFQYAIVLFWLWLKWLWSPFCDTRTTYHSLIQNAFYTSGHVTAAASARDSAGSALTRTSSRASRCT